MAKTGSHKSNFSPDEYSRRIEKIHRTIAGIDEVCRGTLSKRMKKCGTSSCRCHRDPSALHGPYYEWTRMEEGRFVNSMVSALEAERIGKAISNYKEICGLLKEWSRATGELIRAKQKEG